MTGATASQAQEPVNEQEEVRKLMDIATSPALLRQDEAIRKDLAGRGFDTTGSTVTVLIRHLATARVLLVAERIYRTIFGSQIFLLKLLNEAPGKTLPVERVKAHFDAVKEAFPKVFEGWKIDTYLNFLISWELIRRDGDTYAITEYGSEFLTWMVAMALPEKGKLL
jgi:hypothetical protein